MSKILFELLFPFLLDFYLSFSSNVERLRKCSFQEYRLNHKRKVFFPQRVGKVFSVERYFRPMKVRSPNSRKIRLIPKLCLCNDLFVQYRLVVLCKNYFPYHKVTVISYLSKYLNTIFSSVGKF